MSANSLPVFYYIFVDDVVNIEYIAKQEWLVPLIFFFFSFKLFLSLICCTRTDMIFCTWTNTICTQAALCRRPPWPTITCQSSPPPHTGTSIISFPILFSMALDLEICQEPDLIFSMIRHLPPASPFHLRSPSPHLLQPRSPSPHSPHLPLSPHHDRWLSARRITDDKEKNTWNKLPHLPRQTPTQQSLTYALMVLSLQRRLAEQVTI